MKHLSRLGIVACALAAGCANPTKEAPLLFASTNAFGVDIGASPTAGQLPALTLGYKSVDLAMVPVTSESANAASIRGCYSAARGTANAVAPCMEVAAVPQEQAESATRKADSVLTLLKTGDVVAERLVQALPVAPRPGAIPVVSPALPVVGSKALPVPGSNSEPVGQSMRDSLSVYSSFNADTHVGAEAGVQLGKAFATGVAAQQLTEGVNYFMQYKGYALASTSSDAGKELALRTECVSALVTAKEKQVPDQLLPACNEKNPDDLKVRIACVQVLTTAVDKKVPQDKLPKCG